jgi:YidC/Oxa1 family membrane protein insertase
MDKKSIIGLVIIGIILVAWLVFMPYLQNSNKPIQKTQTTKSVDTSQKNVSPEKTTIDSLKEINKKVTSDTTTADDSLKTQFGNIFYKNSVNYYKSSSDSLKEKVIIIENKKVKMLFSNYGGTLAEYYLKEFKSWDNQPIQLIDWKKGKELHLLFTSKDGRLINTKDLVFNSSYTYWEQINLENTKEYKLKYEIFISNDSTQKIVKTYTFHPDAYDFDVDFEILNSDKFISNSKYQVYWSSSLNLTEYRSDDEATFAKAYAYMGEELKDKDANTEATDPKPSDLSGNTDFVGSRIKYFGVFIYSNAPRKGDGAYLDGYTQKLPNEGLRKHYSIALKMDIKNERYEKSSFKIVICPIDYALLKSYKCGFENIMEYSFLDFIVKPIVNYFVIPFFTFLHSFIPNYGLVIIIFAIVLKILLNPLTKKQMKSSKRMQELKPKIDEINEKYKDDPAKKSQKIMRLYKDEGVNPLGAGCLPLLLQLPILYALFGVFRSTIELRQASFIFWIKDLSIPDVVINLPGKIPFFGIDQIPGVATLMGITMFIQQKMTITDPKQKMMVYLMPIFFTLIFFNFPSGLNLYYFVFNLLSIAQQYYMNKKKPDPNEIVKPVKRRKSFMERMNDYAQKRGINKYKK